jgi:predicted amidophosphoribosyltransferase
VHINTHFNPYHGVDKISKRIYIVGVMYKRQPAFKCLGCGKQTISTTGFCSQCQNTKCKACPQCGTPIRWCLNLCPTCAKSALSPTPNEGSRAHDETEAPHDPLS